MAEPETETEPFTLKLEHGGRTRDALVFVPRDAEAPSDGWPVVVMLHGGGGSTRNVVRTGWHTLAQRLADGKRVGDGCIDNESPSGSDDTRVADGFITVYPNGTAPDADRRESFRLNPQTWNAATPTDRPQVQTEVPSAGAGPSSVGAVRDPSNKGMSGGGSAYRRCVDDIGFLDALLDFLADEGARRGAPIDASRVYFSGHSNGAGMALRYAIARPERVAAVGIVAGNMSRRVQPLTPPPVTVPMLQIIGDADPFMPLEGGAVSAFGHSWQELPAISTPQRWTAWHGAEDDVPGTVVEDNESFKLREWRVGDATAARWLVIRGHGHDWPGAPEPLAAGVFGPSNPRGIDATAELWRWMRQFRRS